MPAYIQLSANGFGKVGHECGIVLARPAYRLRDGVKRTVFSPSIVRNAQLKHHLFDGKSFIPHLQDGSEVSKDSSPEY